MSVNTGSTPFSQVSTAFEAAKLLPGRPERVSSAPLALPRSKSGRGATALIKRLKTPTDDWVQPAPGPDEVRAAFVGSAHTNPYSRLVPLLLQGFKELAERCEDLETEAEAGKTRNRKSVRCDELIHLCLRPQSPCNPVRSSA